MGHTVSGAVWKNCLLLQLKVLNTGGKQLTQLSNVCIWVRKHIYSATTKKKKKKRTPDKTKVQLDLASILFSNSINKNRISQLRYLNKYNKHDKLQPRGLSNSISPSQRESAFHQNQWLLSEVWEEALGEKSCKGGTVRFGASIVYKDFELNCGYVQLFSDFQSFQQNIRSSNRCLFMPFFSRIVKISCQDFLKQPTLGRWND